MRKNLGSISGIFPMPVLIIGTYDKEGKIDLMNAAWGMMADTNKIALNLTKTHKTVKNIYEVGAFTVSIADRCHVTEADYVGIVSGNNTKDKFERTKLTATKSLYVNAPVIEEFPITMECKFLEYQDDENGVGVIGEIVNVSVREDILDSNGKVDISKVDAIMYDTFNHAYYTTGEKICDAFKEGAKLK